MLHPLFINHLEQRFTSFFNSDTQIQHHKTVHGGDISQAFMLDTTKGRFLIKVNAAIFGLDMFEKEARGLIHLADTGALKVPRPLFDGKFHQQIFLIMEYVDHGNPAEDFWENFGEGMARLHYNTADRFGMEHDNFLGKLTQKNTWNDSWSDFYSTERILRLVHKAQQKGLLETAHITQAEKLSDQLITLFPSEKPALLHGDLWKGNFIAGANGYVAIYDPAVYYGSREMDIAMAKLFGGFDDRFYASYHYHFPLRAGWEERLPICQLYPLLVHLLLFGGHYRQLVTEILENDRYR